MEYRFGTLGEAETLQTKGSAHTDLTLWQEVTRDYPGTMTITDRFRVVRKLRSSEDSGGNCYDWYIIDRHTRQIDRTGPIEAEQKRNAAYLDYLSMMSGIDLPESEEGGGDDGTQ